MTSIDGGFTRFIEQADGMRLPAASHPVRCERAADPLRRLHRESRVRRCVGSGGFRAASQSGGARLRPRPPSPSKNAQNPHTRKRIGDGHFLSAGHCYRFCYPIP